MNNRSIAAWSLVAVAFTAPAAAQLRVVTYNTLDKPVTAADGALFDTIFSAIATTPRNGIAKRPDIIALQEQTRQVVSGVLRDTSQNVASRLNALFGVTTYQSTLIGSGTDRVSVVYDTSAVGLTQAVSFSTGGPRPTLRAEFQPVGYTSDDAALFQYTSHLKASNTTTDAATRATEATSIRANADALGVGVNAIYAGDLNMSSSSEAGYTNFRAAGNGQAFDPLQLGAWPSQSVAVHLTQSTRTAQLADGGANGGLDDRFDLQLVTSALLDGEGLSYIGPSSAGLGSLVHSYQAFGNDGNTYNQSLISNLTNRSQPTGVIQALHDFSDHLPVVADYQLPAVLAAEIAAAPLTVNLGQAVAIDLLVRNAAAVVAAVGADELDYSVNVAGSLSGAFSGTLAALADAALHQIVLDTTTPGLHSGVVTIATSSQAAANALIELPISYEVLAPTLAGDFNGDNVVNAADYTVWRDGGPLLNETASPGVVDVADYNAWSDNYGASAPAAVAVPEPVAALLSALGIVGFATRRG